MASSDEPNPEMIRVEMVETSSVVRTLEVEVDAKRVDELFERTYKDLAKNAQVRGFRRGKAPRSVLESLYGASVREEVRSLLVNETLPTAMEKVQVNPVAEPAVDAKPAEMKSAFTYSARVEVLPQIQLGDVKQLAASQPSAEVTDEEVQGQIEQLRESRATWEDVDAGTGAELGNRVKCDYVGTIDGTPFEGGEAQGVSLDLGSDQFIPGFEAQLVGAKAGDEVEVNVTFPDDYPAENLAGKAAVFSCKVHDVQKKVLPEFDDALAQRFGGFETVAALRERIATDMAKNKENHAKATLRRTILASLMERTPFEVPEGMIDRMLVMRLQQFYRQYQQQFPAEFLQRQMGALQEQWRPEVEREIREMLLLKAVAEQEGFSVEDAEIANRLETMAQEQGIDLDRLRKMMGGSDADSGLRTQILEEKALEFLVSEANVEERSE